MSLSIGIIGLPNVGKSTLFQALTTKKVDVGNYPFTTINPNIGIVRVTDKRINILSKILLPEKTTPSYIEFIDIAGLIKGAHKGEGLGNQFLAQIRNCDAILHVIRGFDDPQVENVLGHINPYEEIEVIKLELIMKDYENIENILRKIAKDPNKKKEVELLEKLKSFLIKGVVIRKINLTEKEQQLIKEYKFLTQKKVIYLINGELNKLNNVDFEEELISVNLKKINSNQLDQIISKCYNILGLITFFTIAGGKELRAWPLKKGQMAPDAGRVVHSDFEKKFIKAEVISWDKIIEAGNWKKAKEKGYIKTVGRDYIVKDGDIIEFKI
jgi:small GTP-binding protein